MVIDLMAKSKSNEEIGEDKRLLQNPWQPANIFMHVKIDLIFMSDVASKALSTWCKIKYFYRFKIGNNFLRNMGDYTFHNIFNINTTGRGVIDNIQALLPHRNPCNKLRRSLGVSIFILAIKVLHL